MTSKRQEPNVIITGTPGVGKTTHCEQLKKTTGLKHLSINQVVRDRGCHEGWDDELQTYIVDEDKVCVHDDTRRPMSGLLKPYSFWMLSRMKSKMADMSSTGTRVIFSQNAG